MTTPSTWREGAPRPKTNRHQTNALFRLIGWAEQVGYPITDDTMAIVTDWKQQREVWRDWIDPRSRFVPDASRAADDEEEAAQ